MGLPRLSEKCRKCKHKDGCDDKRMAACACLSLSMPKLSNDLSLNMPTHTGVLANHNMPMFNSNYDKELIGCPQNQDKISDNIFKAINENIRKCAHKAGD